jgi:hypothetical protein
VQIKQSSAESCSVALTSLSFRNFPASQSEHEVDPSLAAYFPLEQMAQLLSDVPWLPKYFPVAQAVQLAEEAAAQLPGVHSKQSEALS